MQDFDLNLGGNANVAKDLLPTKKSERNWGIYSYFATWIGMDIGIPTYYLASSLIVGGMDLKWAMFTILLANVIIAFPILANGHAGAKTAFLPQFTGAAPSASTAPAWQPFCAAWWPRAGAVSSSGLAAAR